MMYLNFKCNSCEHEFTTIDEYQVLCPQCHKVDVQVIWDKDDIRGSISCNLKQFIKTDRKELITKLGNKVADRNDEALRKLND